MLCLIGGLLSGCAMARSPSSYKVTIPALEAAPVEIPCYPAGPGLRRCVAIIQESADSDRVYEVITRADRQAIVRALKGACLANGQTEAECLAAPAQQLPQAIPTWPALPASQ